MLCYLHVLLTPWQNDQSPLKTASNVLYTSITNKNVRKST